MQTKTVFNSTKYNRKGVIKIIICICNDVTDRQTDQMIEWMIDWLTGYLAYYDYWLTDKKQ